MRFKKISTRMLAIIVPILILSMGILTIISVRDSSSTIEDQISERMNAELSSAEENIEGSLTSVSTMAETISGSVSATYKTMGMNSFENMLGGIIQTNDMVLGSGLWFEPFEYNRNQEYVGPYIFKDGNEITKTNEYANAEYDYFSQEYYTKAKSAMKTIITDPYYDPTSGIVMSSCSTPILNETGGFAGCVTVDMELSTVSGMVEGIKIGKNGRAMLLDSNGIYLAGVENSKIANGESISSDSNSSLAEAGRVMMSSNNGTTSFTSPEFGIEDLYYTTIPTTGWKVIIRMPREETSQPVKQLAIIMIAVAAIFIVIEVIIVILQVSSIAKGIGKVKSFAGTLAEGDFTVEPIDVRSADELGVMSSSLNDMYDSNKGVISNIAECSREIDDASRRLSESSAELNDQFSNIKDQMNNVNEAMMTTSAATEEVNASTEEVLSNVNLLAGEADSCMEMSREIMGRAGSIEKQSRTSFEEAEKLTAEFSERLGESIKNAAVVETISEMANDISGIAEQVNLLSLNASIEAARAGEAGRGFAVVATEIGNLAGSTSETVGKIQVTIRQVQDAFVELRDSASGILDFVQNTVAPDYDNFVKVAEQYGNDAQNFERASSSISEMSENIKSIMGEVTDAVQNIAEATQDTTNISSKIMDSIEVVSNHVSDVSDMSASQQQIADNLAETVGRFKL
ncbi:MAG: methyl-accepting chemotaxis protein [Lachnospiraceae bacterium]|nr:methyl-accepting chemotaxis protein [Lachnospiraceae bacterium]